jgi:FKBP-type peptidyl-prolyl cis-trans isomerase SlpA
MNDETPTIQPGSSVVIKYTLAIENGTVIESTDNNDPLRFTIGDGTLIEGLEAVVRMMQPGERQCVSLVPQEAFGFADETNVHMLPRDRFPEDMPLEQGLIIGFTTPAGDEVPGKIMEILDNTIVVDFNHPLAGHTVTFDVELVSVDGPSGEV